MIGWKTTFHWLFGGLILVVLVGSILFHDWGGILYALCFGLSNIAAAIDPNKSQVHKRTQILFLAAASIFGCAALYLRYKK